MKKFQYSLNDFIGVDNYFTFFENEEVDGSGPWMASDIFFGFTYLKLLDSALEYSKDEVLKEYENSKDVDILYETAVYPTGETLGFYNTSKYDFGKLSESGIDINTKLNDYIDGFSDNVKQALDAIPFSEVLEFLDKTWMTYNVIKIFNDTEIDSCRFSSYDKFMATFSDFIKSLWDDEIFHMGRDPIATYDALSSYHYIHEAVEEYGSFLTKLLLMDEAFENNESLKIYDPDSSGAYILNDVKNQVLMFKRNAGNFDAEVEIYGKSKKIENESIYLAKKSVAKKDPYEIEDATILDVSENIFSVDGIESYDDFDLIISNYLYNGLSEYKDILETFKSRSDEKTKLVIALNCLDDFIDDLKSIIEHDNLESIISFKNHYIIIANLNKSENKRGHFLLIDKSDPQLDDEQVDRENEQAFSNKNYEIINALHWKTLTKSDHDKMNAIIESYKAFEDSVDAMLIRNEEYDEEMIRILLN